MASSGGFLAYGASLEDGDGPPSTQTHFHAKPMQLEVRPEGALHAPSDSGVCHVHSPITILAGLWMTGLARVRITPEVRFRGAAAGSWFRLEQPRPAAWAVPPPP